MTEVFLVKTLIFGAGRSLLQLPVIPLDQRVIDSFDASRFRRRGRNTGGIRKTETKHFVENQSQVRSDIL